MLRLTPEAKQHISAAQAARFNWGRACSRELHCIVDAHPKAVGSPKEFIFIPLLTVTASFMGVNAGVKVNAEWCEPAVLWTVVAARKGEKKTAALKRILKAVEEIEVETVSEWASQQRQDDDMEPPQLVVQQFSMEALHNVMLRNGSQMLGLYEMSVMYGQLDAYKHSGSTLDRSTLLDLYNGGSWARNFKNKLGPSKMLKTAFNMSGFIQPAFIVSMLDKCDADGFNDRQLFDCPEEVEYKYEELQVPMDASIPPLSLVFKVLREVHQVKVTYTMNEEAMEVFVQYHDELVDRKRAIPDDENRRGVLSKAKGQCARLSMIQYVLGQAVKIAYELHEEQHYSSEDISSKCSTWSKEVTASAVHSAVVITNHFIKQKFLLMPPEQAVSMDTDLSDILRSNFLASHLKASKRFVIDKGTVCIAASEVCRRRLMPPKPLSDASPERKTKYPVDSAKAFIKDIAKEGFGVAEPVKCGAKISLTFKKRKFEELEANSLEILKRLKVRRDSYVSAQVSSVSATSSTSSLEPAITINSPDAE